MCLAAAGLLLSLAPACGGERVLVHPAGSAPGLHLFAGPDVCGDPEAREARLAEGGILVLVPLLVATAGPLTYRDLPYGGFLGTAASPAPALDEFTAHHFPAGERPGEGTPVALAEGAFTLDAAPDYDRGRFQGTYDLVFEDGSEHAGSLDTRYCNGARPAFDAHAPLRYAGW